jgi:hypothetical protein
MSTAAPLKTCPRLIMVPLPVWAGHFENFSCQAFDERRKFDLAELTVVKSVPLPQHIVKQSFMESEWI